MQTKAVCVTLATSHYFQCQRASIFSRLLADNGTSLDQHITDPATEEHLKKL